jgi:hypothetical protein
MAAVAFPMTIGEITNVAVTTAADDRSAVERLGAALDVDRDDSSP